MKMIERLSTALGLGVAATKSLDADAKDRWRAAIYLIRSERAITEVLALL